MACQRASIGNAPSPDTLPNEIIKFLLDTAHVLIYTLFQIMAKQSYTPRKWCISATNLIYKPNITDPHNPTSYIPIAFMNCILKISTSILTTNLELSEHKRRSPRECSATPLTDSTPTETSTIACPHTSQCTNMLNHIQKCCIYAKTYIQHTQTSKAHSGT